MQLNISSDYAIRAMLYLAVNPRRASAVEISEAMVIPLNTCKKNLHMLKKAGLVTPSPGINGGYVLSRNPDQITIFDILRAVGEKTDINRCLEPDSFCSRNAIDDCAVRKVYSAAQKALNEAFSFSLSELASCPCKD